MTRNTNYWTFVADNFLLLLLLLLLLFRISIYTLALVTEVVKNVQVKKEKKI